MLYTVRKNSVYCGYYEYVRTDAAAFMECIYTNKPNKNNPSHFRSQYCMSLFVASGLVSFFVQCKSVASKKEEKKNQWTLFNLGFRFGCFFFLLLNEKHSSTEWERPSRLCICFDGKFFLSFWIDTILLILRECLDHDAERNIHLYVMGFFLFLLACGRYSMCCVNGTRMVKCGWPCVQERRTFK